MTKFKLGKKDRELLELLRLNSRASFTELGKKLRLSSSTVERKLSRLKEQKVITLLFASVNFTKLGFKHYQIYFKFDAFDENMESEVSKFIESYERTNWSAICEGAYDVIWAIFAYDEFEANRALGLFMEKFGGNVRDKVIATTIWDTALTWKRNQNKKQSKRKYAPLKDKTDEIDMKLLAALYWNSRSTTVELAKLTGLSPVAVARRIKDLVANDYILNYTAWYPMYERPEYYMIFINFRNITREKEALFTEFCSQSKEIFFTCKFMSGWDIELSVRVDSITELHRFMSRMKAGFGSIIGNYSYVTVLKDVTHRALQEYLE
jgi:DNA-binding Lrp family transcriptional regulator